MYISRALLLLFGIAFILASVVTFSLFYLMQSLIGVEGTLDDSEKIKVVDFVRVKRSAGSTRACPNLDNESLLAASSIEHRESRYRRPDRYPHGDGLPRLRRASGQVACADASSHSRW